MIFCIGTALLSIPSSNGPSDMQLGAIMLAIMVGSADNVWHLPFAAADTLNRAGWDPIIAMLAEFLEPTSRVGENVANSVNRGLQTPTNPQIGMTLMAILPIATSFITAFLHLYFMLLPSDRHENRFGQNGQSPITGLRKPAGSHNPIEGYDHLFEKTEAEKARQKRDQRAEVKSLYRQSVLGNTNKPV